MREPQRSLARPMLARIAGDQGMEKPQPVRKFRLGLLVQARAETMSVPTVRGSGGAARTIARASR
ncbi:hypothetical protein GCM10022206_01540 [Streptomyces chiangmaiensis]